MVQDAHKTDTITALATAPGRCGISVIRISGADSLKITASLFSRGDTLKNHPRMMRYGHIKRDSSIVDEALVCYMPRPHSYTGEDVVEIQCHGGYATAREILSLLIEHGCRAAEPGEFTKRAFLNGRIDLVQAEAVMEVVSAETAGHLKCAERLMNGSFSHRIESIVQTLTHTLSLLDFNIEFIDQGLQTIHHQELITTLDTVIGEITGMIDSYATAKRLKSGISVVFAGNVNAGKSSLFNRLIGRPRAIVNERPGTTRDWIEESITIESTPLTFIDTAGIRDTEDDIEQEGVRHTHRLVEDADIVLMIHDASTFMPEIVTECETFISGHIVPVINKIDLTPGKTAPDGFLMVSAHTGEGIPTLQKKILSIAASLLLTNTDATIILIERHRDALIEAKSALKRARESLDSYSEEIASLEIHHALDAIESILGVAIDIDTLDTIFSQFCIGK